MSNVITMGCTSDYLVSRAARHRRAGRYDEAMALLWKAKNQFGLKEEIELEMAGVYEEIGCDEEAARAYLRVVRLGGKGRATALFNLALLSAQKGDTQRAISYFELFAACENRAEAIPEEMAGILARQLAQDAKRPSLRSERARARALERRAAACLQEGRAAAAQRAMKKSLRIRPTAQGYTMLACCHLIRQNFSEAVNAALTAHRLSPSKVQTLCVLSDAYAAMGQEGPARRAMYLASLRAGEVDDLLAVAMESAKHGDDSLTLRMTKRLLGKAPYHTRAMMLRACALNNLGQMQEASRLFGRLCGLLPEDSVCESYFRLMQEGRKPAERLSLGVDVTREEGIARAAELVSMLYESPQQICADPAKLRRICRLCGWAFHSPMAGSHTKTVALILLSAMEADCARDVLLDVLTDAQLADHVKQHVLQILTAKEGFKPYEVDIGGRLMRLAAGGVSVQPTRSPQANARPVQRAADALSMSDPDAPEALLGMYLSYIERYGQPDKRHESACSAALEAQYLVHAGRKADFRAIAARYETTPRLIQMMMRRLERSMDAKKPGGDEPINGGDSNEVH